MSWRTDWLASSKFNLDAIRINLHVKMQKLLSDEFSPSVYRVLSMWNLLSDKLKLSCSPYGIAESADFGDYTDIMAHMFGHNNKQYYIYRAVSNDSKIGFLSRKQYYKMKLQIDLMHIKGCSKSAIYQYKKEFCDKNGRAASPFRMFKRAIIENPKMKFLDNKLFFKVVDAHDRIISRDNQAEKIINILFTACSPITLEETDDIQQCYDVQLPDGYEHSDKRFCTHSCMEGVDVGEFYNSFPVKGVLVKNRDKIVGRFLLWTLPDGKQYVDRLYVRAANAKTAISAIDRQYPDAIKYPALTDKAENPDSNKPLPFYAIAIKDLSKFLHCNRFAWVDTFAHLIRNKETDEYYIANTTRPSQEFQEQFSKFKHIWAIRGGTPVRQICPDCGKLLVGGIDPENNDYMHKLLHCKEYVPTGRKEPIYLALLKEYINNIGDKNGQRNKESDKQFNSLFSV